MFAVIIAPLGGLIGCASGQPVRVAAPGTVQFEVPTVEADIDFEEVDDEHVEPTPAGPARKQPGLIDAMTEMVDRAQQNATEAFGAFVFQLDDFFAAGQKVDEPNTSFLRVRLDAVRPVLDGFEFDPSVKLRVVLPQTEQRFRLLLSTDDEVSTEADVERVARTTDDEDVSLALRFVRGARDSLDLKLDLGLRQREGLLQLFGRVKTEYRGDLSERWSARFSNRYYFFARTGFEDRLRFDFTRKLGSLDHDRSHFFRSSTTFDWSALDPGTSIGQTLGVYLDLSARSALAIEGVAVYDTELKDDDTEHFRFGEFRLRYRRNFWRPWLFYELHPAVTFPAERDFRRTFNGLARIEVTIGGDALLPLQNAVDGTRRP